MSFCMDKFRMDNSVAVKNNKFKILQNDADSRKRTEERIASLTSSSAPITSLVRQKIYFKKLQFNFKKLILTTQYWF